MKMFGKTGSMTFPMSYDYQGEYYDFARKGWKGLSSLEKSLSVALGIVSSVCIALMIAVIVVGVQRTACDPISSTPPTSTKTTTPRQPTSSTSDYCDTPVPDRPPRKKTLRRSNVSSNAQPSLPKDPFMPISMAECITLHERNSSICLTSQCFSKAAEIIESLDTTANPCENFYQFACGNWDKNNQKPDYMLDWNQIDLERRKRLYEVKGIPIESFSLRGLLEKDHSLLDSRSLRLAKQYYHSCVHSADDEVGVAEIRLLLEDLTALDEASTMKSLSESLGRQRRFFDSNSIISLSVALDDKSIAEKSIFIGKPPGILNLGNKIHWSEMSGYEDDGRNKVTHEAYRDFVRNLWLLVFPEDKENLDDIITGIFEFGRKLTEISNASKDYIEDLDGLNQSELGEVNLSPAMRSWLQDLVGNVMNEVGTYDNETEKITILINDVEYFTGLENAINVTSPTAIGNYLRLDLLLKYSAHAGRVFRKLFREFEEKIFKDELPPMPRWITCTQEATEFYGMALSYASISSQERIHVKDQLNQTVIQLKEAFNESIEKLSWISSDEMRQYLQEKIEIMQTHIGYPEWLLNETQTDSNESSFIENLYSELDFTDPTNYFQNYVETMIWFTTSKLSGTRGAATWPAWQYLTNTRSSYFQYLNELALPLDMIDSTSIPLNAVFPSLHYGSEGIQIAREMMQAIVGSGSAGGLLASWGDNVTFENYKNVSDCFKEQLYEIGNNRGYPFEESDEIFQQPVLYSGALSVAFKAYQSQIASDETFNEISPPGLQDFSPEQLYFLTFAQKMCSSSSNKISSLGRRKHPWDISQILLESTLRNSVDFAKHWACPIREESCKVF